jgi:Fe(3+) dicitrate transport protein
VPLQSETIGVAKFRVNSDADAKVYQSLTAKLQYSEDFANETYLD